MESFIDIALWIALIMVVVAILAAAVMPLINSFGNPRSLIKGGVGVAGILVVFLISWAIAGDEVTRTYTQFGVDATSSKLVGGTLTLMYILFIIAVIGIVFSEINKALK